MLLRFFYVFKIYSVYWKFRNKLFSMRIIISTKCTCLTFHNEVGLEKLRGGYYTPEPIARFICNWAIDINTKGILEPSCGDGVFLKEAAKTFTVPYSSEINPSKCCDSVSIKRQYVFFCSFVF